MKISSLMIVLPAMLAIGCQPSVNAPAAANTSTNTVNSNANTAIAPVGAKAEVTAAAHKFLELKFYTAKIENMAEKQQSKTDVKYASPDRFHIKNDKGEVIAIGPKGWLKQEGKWTLMPEGDTSIFADTRDSFKDAIIGAATDFKSEGEETIDSKPAHIYSYNAVTPTGNIPFTVKLWVNKATGLPMKMHSAFSNGALKWATVTYDTNTPVTIEQPM